MQTLKTMIRRYMQKMMMILVVFVLLGVVLAQLLNEQHRAYENAQSRFDQMEQVLADNQKDLDEVKQEYREMCLKNAEAIDYIIEKRSSSLPSVTEMQRIAELIGVDEIHLFDEKGCIFKGTHPEYYGLTFDSGEQIGFFKPLLKDKTLRLCQEVTPNTARNKNMQYSALWSKNGEFIVQVGMEPVNIMKVTEKNELSYIFSLLRVNVEANFYAVDAESGEVVGSTVEEDLGKGVADAGFDFEKVKKDADGFHADINGEKCFCIFKKMDNNYIGYVITIKELYQRAPNIIFLFLVSLLAIAIILVYAVTKYMNKFVVGGIHCVNEKLHAITEGNLDEKVDVQTSVEFSELSNYINEMVHSLLANTEKLSYVLNKGNLHIGVYEYNLNAKKIRFTEYIPGILKLDERTIEKFSSDYSLFQNYMNELRRNRVEGEEDVYCLSGEKDTFIKLDEMIHNNEIFGVMIDVTDEIVKRREIEEERDRDLLTGLYNRRGIEYNLSQLFQNKKSLGCAALIMIDGDGLKIINDTYGHEKGDIYLKKIADVINGFGIGGCLAGRLGGDEFILLLYRYNSEDELLNTINTLEYIQQTATVHLDNNISVPLRFSYGYSLVDDTSGYDKLIKEADEKMYANKQERKTKQGNYKNNVR